MIVAPSFRSGRALLTVKARPFVLTANCLPKLSSVHLGKRLSFDDAGRSEDDVNLALLASDPGIEPVEIGEVRYISLHCNDTAANQRYRLVKFRLTAPGNVNEFTFINEALGRGETLSATATSDDSDFSLELRH
jgi:hypothetical protein